MTARSALYRMAALLGDVQAARKGPAAMGRRMARKVAYRHVGRTTRIVLRRAGL